MKIDWIAPLRHLLQTLSFCLAISAMVATSLSEVASALEPGRWKTPMATAFLLSR